MQKNLIYLAPLDKMSGFLAVFARKNLKDDFVKVGEVRVGGISQKVKQLAKDNLK